MISGIMYSLRDVLKIENCDAALYIMDCSYDCDNKIYFGRNRKISISDESYIVKISDGKYELEKIEFDSEGVCDYLKLLSDKNIAYWIPKKLPESRIKSYSRFENAIGKTFWSGTIRGYFGTNGHAITDVSHIGDDRYESYAIKLNVDSLKIGDHYISYIDGYKIPNDKFIEKVLESEICLEEGEPVIAMLNEAGVTAKDEIENIRLVEK